MTNPRTEQLHSLLEAKQLEAIIIDSPINRRYLSGFTGSAGTLLLTTSASYLLTDFRYRTQAAEQAKGYQVLEYMSQPMVEIKTLLQKLGINKVGFEQDHISFAQYKQWENELAGIELSPTAGLVEQIRMIKDQAELQIIQEAADLADRTFAHILNYIKPGVRELDIALEMEMFMRSNGATSSSFETIVASGERSALPHGIASERIIGNNEFVKLDFGAYYKGYCSDITRTVVVGKPTEKHLEIYNIVLEAQMNALANIKPGVTGVQGDAFARDVITNYGYGELFGHGTGHGIGMEIHEAPRLSRFSDTILTPGMTVTVEPGIYIPGFGGVRIEDDIVITQTGIQILTKSPKELILV
ncbi:MAG: Xaa-Pro peptidase family protein [Candidatus Pristimantibacillus lignocellulolyticus]|uniref:Xaa-Pro peptidase family protein n=1 Tax=Candidatus Pristimantibacillus lignocellulolyticus TaxID=2994561 RepID=A0A9J6ZE12_9BACL|nr:MAG: Xaa-Pro peptidase family protein [Candidatus Pristimantibacillus lignocellulolyticus]